MAAYARRHDQARVRNRAGASGGRRPRLRRLCGGAGRSHRGGRRHVSRADRPTAGTFTSGAPRKFRGCARRWSSRASGCSWSASTAGCSRAATWARAGPSSRPGPAAASTPWPRMRPATCGWAKQDPWAEAGLADELDEPGEHDALFLGVEPPPKPSRVGVVGVISCPRGMTQNHFWAAIFDDRDFNQLGTPEDPRAAPNVPKPRAPL